jgi:hypothetical protein
MGLVSGARQFMPFLDIAKIKILVEDFWLYQNIEGFHGVNHLFRKG